VDDNSDKDENSEPQRWSLNRLNLIDGHKYSSLGLSYSGNYLDVFNSKVIEKNNWFFKYSSRRDI